MDRDHHHAIEPYRQITNDLLYTAPPLRYPPMMPCCIRTPRRPAGQAIRDGFDQDAGPEGAGQDE
jgi:hypothetical protein